MVEEQGVNILYLALGQLKWFEAEHADCVLAVFPQGAGFAAEAQRDWAPTSRVCDELRAARWFGAPNEA